MNEDKNIHTPNFSEIESEIYAVVNLILNLFQKFQNGELKNSFFQKSIKNSFNDLLRINFNLKENNLLLLELLERMNFKEKYYEALDIINNYTSVNFDNDLIESNYIIKLKPAKSLNSSMFELPGITSKITSSFITLLDALKLEVINSNLITNLSKELINNLEKFPGLEQITFKVKQIDKTITKNIHKLEKSQKLRDSIGNDLYQIYKEFINKLNMKI
ncbi:MAG: hypothetical protein ACFFD5_09615 [Candidatus Thorarchaeota archaeon]